MELDPHGLIRHFFTDKHDIWIKAVEKKYIEKHYDWLQIYETKDHPPADHYTHKVRLNGEIPTKLLANLVRVYHDWVRQDLALADQVLKAIEGRE